MGNEKKRIRRNTKRARRVKTIIFFMIILIIACGAFFTVKDFSTKKIIVRGNKTYTDQEIIETVMAKDYVPNTIIMSIVNKLFGLRYLPFIAKVDMGYTDTHTLLIEVEEMPRAGVYLEKDKYVYFDENGNVLEKRYHLFSGVPIVDGVTFKKTNVNQKIETDGDYVSDIIYITDRISGYNLDISRIQFDGEDDLTLYSGKYSVYMGSKDSLNNKMSKIPEVLIALGKKHDSGSVDMSHYTEDNNIITYKE